MVWTVGERCWWWVLVGVVRDGCRRVGRSRVHRGFSGGLKGGDVVEHHCFKSVEA